MPFLRFIGFCLILAAFAIFFSFLLGAVAGKFSDYHGGRMMYDLPWTALRGYPWTEAVMIALFIWGVSAALAGYALGALRHGIGFPLMRLILLVAAVVAWVAVSWYVARWSDGLAMTFLALHSLAYGAVGAVVGNDHFRFRL